MPSIINATTTNGVAVSGDNSGALALQTNNGTTAVTIDTSQNVGIGTTSPVQKLDVSGTAVASTINARITNTDSNSASRAAFQFKTGASSNVWQAFARNNQLVFGIDAVADYMLIDSSGRVCINTTSFITDTSSLFNVTSNDVTTNIEAAGGTNAGACSVMRRKNGTGNFLYFVYTTSNTYVGQISTNGTTTSYTSASDYRLKDEITPMTGALETVAQLNPVKFKFKSDNSNGQGFIAHELQAVVPDAVTGEKDAVDAEGKPVYQGVDTSFLVATLTAAIQELKAELDATKAEVQALKGA